MEQELIPHLFRTEYSKIVSVLAKYLGIDHIGIAEDIAGDTFLSALETWPYKGIPENPVAWLYSVAKNKTTNFVNRRRLFSEKIVPQIKRTSDDTFPEIDLSVKNITDSQLQMLFAICHPSIPPEAQIGLSLRILCGFGIDEIATALLTNKETINKRLFRAREKLRIENVAIELPSQEKIKERLGTVMTTLYLLFNEGYYSESSETILREDLCLEAMRLTYLLIENETTNQPPVNALLALMCFHSSRFEARKNKSDEIILYDEQDESLWNQELISRGVFYLNRASQGNNISKYHLEASIAWWHTVRNDTVAKWETILDLYNQLLIIEYSPVAALNRTFALSKVKGKKVAIDEAEKLKMADNRFYFMLLGELYKYVDNNKAKEYYQTALSMAKSIAEKKLVQKNINNL